MRILIVDDNVDTTKSAAELFAFWGHDTCVAYSGLDAIEVAAANAPNVVLLDIGLPGMDGYEVARRMRRDPRLKDTILIAISGYSEQSQAHRASEAGFDEYLNKPFNLSKLNDWLIEKAKAKGGTSSQIAGAPSVSAPPPGDADRR